MTGVLIDTHILFWILAYPERLSPAQKEVIEQSPNRCLSAISIFEIGQKIRLGKWPEAENLYRNLETIAQQFDINLLPITAQIARYAADLSWHHRDPVDRFILATAREHNLSLITADRAFEGLGAPLVN